MLADIDVSQDKGMNGLEITQHRFGRIAEMASGRAQNFDHGHVLWRVGHIFLRFRGLIALRVAERVCYDTNT